MAYLDAEQKPFPPERCDALEKDMAAMKQASEDAAGELFALRLVVSALMQNLSEKDRQAVRSRTAGVRHQSAGFARMMQALGM